MEQQPTQTAARKTMAEQLDSRICKRFSTRNQITKRLRTFYACKHAVCPVIAAR